MKRADALANMRIAGYHGDDRAFMRIYTENRISYAAAKRERDSGAAAKRAGTACGCNSCKAHPECSICPGDMLHAGPCDYSHTA